jgi:D-alanyl-lipoteichoic acid acyltransferase DltB (MBOAT superfamily)
MSFCTVIFLLFLPVVFGLHWLVPRRGWQNGVLLAASYVFYGWWDWRFCGLMLGSSCLDFFIAQAIHAEARPSLRTRWLVLAVTLHLAVLGTFKYFGFFADSLAILLGAVGYDLPTPTAQIILPLGISFYTFQSMAYAIDVHQRRIQPTTSLAQYLVFVAFFPQLVAGPIERAAALLPQFNSIRRFSRIDAVRGCRLVLWGALKKLLIADNLAAVVDPVYAGAGAATASAGALLCGTLAFGFQIYADFSGYSDMAAGLATLFGIRLSRNFRTPYFAASLPEFWRRWHITLSEWMRDYLFIPLGGSRGNLATTSKALVLTFLASGLWHGADWHFVLWGAYHGLGVVAVHALRQGLFRGASTPRTRHRFASTVLTFLFVQVGWVFFRAQDTGDVWHILDRFIFGWADPRAATDALSILRSNAAGLGVLAAWLLAEWRAGDRWDPLPWNDLPRPLRWAGYSLLLWGLLAFGTRRPADFIYFQF